MHINLTTISGALLAVWLFIKKWYKDFSSVIIPIVNQVEQLAQDGTINKADRKAIVMKAIDLLQAQGKIKINFIEKIILSKIVDMIAEKLPDFTVSKATTDTVNKVIEFMNVQTNTESK